MSNFYYKNQKQKDSSYYSKNQTKIKKIMSLRAISGYSGLKNNSNVSNQNINNTIIKNYFNFNNTINNYQIKKANINNISKTSYCNNKFVEKILYNNYINKMNIEINYKPKYKVLGNKNKTTLSLRNHKKNMRVHDYKTLFGNYTSFIFQNSKKKY